jgi:hypothetical protein
MKLGDYKQIQLKIKHLTVAEDEVRRVLLKQQYLNQLQITEDDSWPESHPACRRADGSAEQPDRQKAQADPSASAADLSGTDFADLTGSYTRTKTAGRQRPVIRCLQTIDDAFAQDFSSYPTLEEWKEAIRDELQAYKDDKIYDQICRALIRIIASRSELSVDPELRDTIAAELYQDFLYHIRASHLELPDYLKRTNQTEENLKKKYLAKAEESIRTQLILHEVARLEKLSVSEDELADFLDHDTDSDDSEEIEALRDELLMDKAMDRLVQLADIESV